MNNSKIIGTVTDSSNDPLPGITVTSENLQTNLKTRAVTGANGSYFLTHLESGSYLLTFEMSGFNTLEKRVNLGPDNTIEINVILSISNNR